MNPLVTLTDVLQQQVAIRPQALALIDARASTCLTFAELAAQSAQAASRLQQAGLQAGEAALMFQPMSAQLYIALLGAFRLGAIAMFVDPSAGLQRLERCCALFPPKALIASPKAHLLRLKSPALRQIPLKFSTGFYRSGQAARPLDATLPPDAPALLTFTSGSTGQPKAAVRSHSFLLAQHQALASSLSLTPDTLDLTTLPIFVLANLASGVTSLIPDVDLRYPGRINAARVMRQIQDYQPVSTAASPAFLARLVDYCDRHSLQLPSFQRIFSGGAPVFPNLLADLQALAPQAEVTAVYGSTEAEPIAHITYRALQPADLDGMTQGKGLLTGTPVPEVHLRILPDRWGQPLAELTQPAFEALSLPTGAVGEIVVSGNHVLSGYLKGEGDRETKFRVEGTSWHRTGDAGYLDEQGRLWLLGRCAARIEDDAGVLYPFAVEAAASQHPQVHRTAMVSHKGNRVLLVEWKSRGDLDGLRRSLAWAQIQDYRTLRQIPVDKRHNAKIDYPALQKMLRNL